MIRIPVARVGTSNEVGRHLLRDEGEVVVDEVRKHWVAYLRAINGFALAGVLVLLSGYVRVDLGWLPLSVAGLVFAYSLWLWLSARKDVFVITNMRVFRLHGVLSRQLSTMPLGRILDITVAKPLLGRILGYGHFIFESAAQEQGLREIRWVSRPNERDLAIQRVVQRSGLRGPRVVN